MALITELAEDQLNVGADPPDDLGLAQGFDFVAAFSADFDVVRAGSADDRTLAARRIRADPSSS